MCGLAGLYSSRLSRDELQKVIANMTEALQHRGPDDKGIYTDPSWPMALGHQRLSILDLSQSGHQPMVSASGRYAIAYNGEVYNYKQLAQELEAYGFRFASNCDTEVILAAIEHWGVTEAAVKFIGMFAFALWDKRERCIYLVRDRFGKKPLYFSLDSSALAFASELRSFYAVPNKSYSIDLVGLDMFLQRGYVPQPYSIFKEIAKVPPGMIFTFTVRADGAVQLTSQETYWSTSNSAYSSLANPFLGSEEDAAENLEQLLLDAVKLRMVADVPLGVFLSGGIDSSLVTSLMQHQSAKPIKTFSVGFEVAGYNESEFAAGVARHLQTDHHEIILQQVDLLNIVDKLPQIFDEPLADSSQIPTYLVSKAARNYVTVCLSGDGGDEFFGGYNRYFWTMKLWNMLKSYPRFSRTLLQKALVAFPPTFYDLVLRPSLRQGRTVSGDRIHKLASILDARSEREIYDRLTSFWQSGQLTVGANQPDLLTQDVSQNLAMTQYMMLKDAMTYLSDDILTKVDRASMSVSLETRAPLLDHRVFEFAWRLPETYKIKGNTGKHILKKVLFKYVPRELIERPKVGFSVPIEHWLRSSLRDWAESLLSEKSLREGGIIQPQLVRKRWQEHLSGKRNWQYQLWPILMFEQWRRAL
jgi:asparagine synthase (glutamine-hydrolysing)